jgi:hypothetical protein
MSYGPYPGPGWPPGPAYTGPLFAAPAAPVAGYGYWRPGYPHPLFGPAAWYRPASPASNLAKASFILGLCWFFWLGSILAVVFGHLALRDSRHRGEAPSVLALAGVALGWIGMAALGILVYGAFVVV